MSTSVVICTHSFDRLLQVKQCVASVLAGTRLPDELLIVVDRNPALFGTLNEALPASTVIIENPGIGASDARNAAVAISSSEVVVCIDDDAWAEPGWLASMAQPFDDRSVVGAGGRIVPDWADAKRTVPPELYWIVGATYAGHRTDAGPITRPIGASMAARRSAMLEVGGFSSDFGPKAGGKSTSMNEELVLFTALRRRFGPDCVRYVPSAVVHHYAPTNRTTWSYLKERSLVEGRSKADAQSLLGRGVLGHDRKYLSRHLLPSLGGYAIRAVAQQDRAAARAAAQGLLSLGWTVAGYLSRKSAMRFRATFQRPPDS